MYARVNGPELRNRLRAISIRRHWRQFTQNSSTRTGLHMIRIEREREVGPGIYEYRVWGHPIFGKSRQPLLDACRQLKAMGGFTGQRAGVFREGSIVADISCLVEAGALVTVKEEDKGRVKFTKYQEHWATRQPEQQAA
jgi:hypothetical protein